MTTIRRPLFVALLVAVALAVVLALLSYVTSTMAARDARQAEVSRALAARSMESMTLPKGFVRATEPCTSELGTVCLTYSGTVDEALTPLVAMLAFEGEVVGAPKTGSPEVDALRAKRTFVQVPVPGHKAAEVHCQDPSATLKKKVKYKACFVYASVEGAKVLAVATPHQVPKTSRFKGSDITVSVIT